MSRSILISLAFAIALGGCTDQESESPKTGKAAAPPAPVATASGIPTQQTRVLDSFKVGENIYVRSLAVEADSGTLWVGTSTGVHEVDLATNEVRNTFTRDHGLANEYVFAIGIDHDGNKWFGTNAGGMSRYKDGVWKTFFPMHGLADYWVYSFATQKSGALWVGTWAGANRVDPLTGEFETYLEELVNEWVYGLAVDSQDRVWFGTEGGVSRFDGKKWVEWTHADGLGAPNLDGRPPSTNTGLGTRARHDLGTLRAGMATYNPGYVFSIHVAQDDTVWAGTWGGGVGHFDGKKWTNYTTADGLAGNIVYSIAQDDNGVLWFGTDKGVTRFDGNQWTSIGIREGFPGYSVYTLAVAPGGDIWAGTRGNVVRMGIPK